MEGFLIPQQIFVGDEAKFYYPLPPNINAESLTEFNAGKIKQNTEMTVTNVSVEKRDNTYFLSVDFVAWETGNINFPYFSELGLNISLPSVFVSSVLEARNTEKLQPSRPPLLIPGTIYMLYGYSVLFLLLLIFSSFLFIGFKKLKHCFFYGFSAKNNNKVFYKKLKKLNARLKKIYKLFETNKTSYLKYENFWFKEYETALKNYLCFFCKRVSTDVNWKSLTYSEILNILKENTSGQNVIYNNAELLFKTIQIVRFSKVDFFSKEVFNYQNLLITKSFDLISLYKIAAAKRKEGK